MSLMYLCDMFSLGVSTSPSPTHPACDSIKQLMLPSAWLLDRSTAIPEEVQDQCSQVLIRNP